MVFFFGFIGMWLIMLLMVMMLKLEKECDFKEFLMKKVFCN